MFDVNTRPGRWVEYGLIVITLLSVILVFVESTYGPSNKIYLFDSIEVALTVLFTLEYVLRVITAQKEEYYPLSFFGVIDLITLLPVYLIIIFPGMSVVYSNLFRLMRVLRILRLIKIMRYMNSAGILWQGLVASYRKLLVFFFIISIIICLFAGAMYIVEGPDNGFPNLPVALYWSVVTITTVGYGDITPHTPTGRIISSLLILIGYTIVAIPTGVLSAHMTEIVQRRNQEKKRCTQCNYLIEDTLARYCGSCGYKLKD